MCVGGGRGGCRYQPKRNRTQCNRKGACGHTDHQNQTRGGLRVLAWASTCVGQLRTRPLIAYPFLSSTGRHLHLHPTVCTACSQALARAKAAGGPAPKLQRWKPNGGTLAVMMVTLGRDDGVMRAGGLVFSGCVPALIKSRGLFVQKYRKLLKVNAPGPAPGAAGAAGASGLGRGAVGVAAVAGAPVGAVQAAAEVAQAVAAGCDGGSGSR